MKYILLLLLLLMHDVSLARGKHGWGSARYVVAYGSPRIYHDSNFNHSEYLVTPHYRISPSRLNGTYFMYQGVRHLFLGSTKARARHYSINAIRTQGINQLKQYHGLTEPVPGYYYWNGSWWTHVEYFSRKYVSGHYPDSVSYMDLKQTNSPPPPPPPAPLMGKLSLPQKVIEGKNPQSRVIPIFINFNVQGSRGVIRYR